MNSKERIRNILNFEEADRVGICDELWPETIKNWEKEGYPRNKKIYQYFDFDFWWIMFDQRMGFEEKIIKQESEHAIIQNIDGGIFKIKKINKEYVISEDFDLPGIPLDYKIKTRKDWEKYKNLFTPDKWRIAFKPKHTNSYGATPKNLDDLKKTYKEFLNRDMYIFFSAREVVENIKTKLGMENFLTQLALNPTWIMEMFEADVNLTIEMFKMYEELNINFDGFWAWGDIAYKNGGLFSPETYKKIVMPYHKKLFSFFKEKNMPIIYHSDGFVEEYIPMLIESGVTALQPLEVKAGMDAIKLKKKYGKNLALIGNIDARVMAKSKNQIEEEIKSKIPLLKKDSGYIYHSDHSIPADVSLDNYKYVLECVKKYGTY